MNSFAELEERILKPFWQFRGLQTWFWANSKLTFFILAIADKRYISVACEVSNFDTPNRNWQTTYPRF